MFFNMDRIRLFLQSLPKWILSCLCLAAILWLTLAPKPLGDNEIHLFEGSDKLAHALMFGGYTFCILLDWTRTRRWSRIPAKTAVLAVLAAITVGIATELAQQAMHIGRSGDLWDLVADSAGSILTACLMRRFPFERG